MVLHEHFKLPFSNKSFFADDTSNCKSYQWLVDQVLPQFVKWGEEDTRKRPICMESLSLISKDKYYKKYNELKMKYGKEMVEVVLFFYILHKIFYIALFTGNNYFQVWPEGTDPSKYVYEDVAIATYLLLLWEDGNEGDFRKKTFVDLGCGNGLLVYILAKEGHTGLGIDVRKRQIWDMYPDDVKLEVRVLFLYLCKIYEHRLLPHLTLYCLFLGKNYNTFRCKFIS